MDKKKAKDPQIWKRLGLELAALHDLIVEIQCDKDYASVMDSKTWDRLYKLTYHLDIVRRMDSLILIVRKLTTKMLGAATLY